MQAVSLTGETYSTTNLISVSSQATLALLQGAVPVFALLRASRIAVHPVLQTHPRERSGVGIPRPDVDHATECRTAVQDRTGPFDDFDLFQVLEGEEASGRLVLGRLEVVEYVARDDHVAILPRLYSAALLGQPPLAHRLDVVALGIGSGLE